MKILAVDDIKSWRDFHQHMLGLIFQHNTQIELACSAREGYNKALNNITAPYDLIISDLQMESDYEPEHAGEWMVREIKLLDAYRKKPFMLISASYDINITAQKLGVDFIPKSSLISDPQKLKFKLEELGLVKKA